MIKQMGLINSTCNHVSESSCNAPLSGCKWDGDKCRKKDSAEKTGEIFIITLLSTLLICAIIAVPLAVILGIVLLIIKSKYKQAPDEFTSIVPTQPN